MVVYKEQRWYQKLFAKILKIFKKQNKIITEEVEKVVGFKFVCFIDSMELNSVRNN